MNASFEIESAQGKGFGREKSCRKRRRNENFKRFSVLTVAGIAAICSPNVARNPPSDSFAFAFFHPAPFPTIKRHLNAVAVNNKLDTSMRAKLDTTLWEILDDRKQSRKSKSIDKTNAVDSDLVISTTQASTVASLPPWLAAQEESADMSSWVASKRVRKEMELFEVSLMTFQGGELFSKDDVRDIIRAIYWCASTNSQDRTMSEKVSKIVGCVSFCRLLLKLEDDSLDGKKKYQYINTINSEKKIKNDKKGYLISKDVLLASILHYSECVDLRYSGMYDEVQRALYEKSFLENSDEEVRAHLLKTNDESTSVQTRLVLPNDDNFDRSNQDASIVLRRQSESQSSSNNNGAFENIFSPEVLKLASAATRLKRIEILKSVTLTSGGDHEIRRRPLSSSEYAAARNLMVSVTDDWRALAIRCTASLFRLEGILKYAKVNAGTGDFSRRRRDSETTLVAKDSLKMYANLSQQMGLHRLHSQLEAKAFRILYPRQYSASSALFQEHGAAMNAIAGFLSNQLNQMLCEDLSLMFELENLEVVSRVKEPYSFWKKLLKTRIGPIALSTKDDNLDSSDGKLSLVRTNEQNSADHEMMRSSELSILEINDGVALRVIFKARKLHPDESPETTRERERMLCYYIHHMVRSKWPETDQSRVKDYVRFPKPNGYQSLHHTSKITRNNQDFHFEVQVRSEEMHRLAEFGVAAHSKYKLGGSNSNPKILSGSKPPSPLSLQSSTDISSSVTENSDLSDQSLTLVSNPKNSKSNAPVIDVNDSENAGPYIHALEKSRQSLMQSQVYVFLAGGSSSTLENGQLVTLSAGSRVIDVLESLRETNAEFEFEDDEVNVWCNGNIAGPEEMVKNGDMILIQPTPSLFPITEILVNKTSSSNTIVVS